MLVLSSSSRTNARETQPSTSSSVPEGERDKRQVDVASKDQHEPVKGVDTAPTRRDTPPEVQPPVSVIESGEKCMVSSHGEGSPMARKRPHESTVDSESQRDDGGGGEPPTKTPGTEDKQQVTPSGENKDKNEGAAEPAARKKEATEGDKATAKKNVPEENSQTSADGPDKDPTDMEYAQVVVKRPLEVDEGNDNGASSACEPLPKAPFVRRPTLRIQPKVPPDRRSAPSTEKKAPPAEPP
ncbi:hypothetical protein HPB52_021712 [Rhipicephalus sanguineus]|uniref:Uncharacterized protein n=1 Tax=Rhipicephalus sanguineus TaxID=34632 RepID=A0A9D4Q7F5_RHISA|nr:hypothetical protein HPB52_021712 [Rhipicephalus sanguineus]